MTRVLGRFLGAVIGLVLIVVAGGLISAHVAIRGERPRLPSAEQLSAAVGGAEEGPVRVAYVNTASQWMPRANVLAPGRDPRAGERHLMSHPSFVLEWADGRILLIDAGMSRDAALDFGRLLETFGGAEHIEPLGSIAEGLGDASRRVEALLFTHLHTDHVEGIEDLCSRIDRPVRVFLSEAQDERTNYLTRPGRRHLRDARCVRIERLPGRPLGAIDGFPGVFVLAAGGHTPGSQAVVAAVGDGAGSVGYVFTGDIANNIDGILHDIPKPFLYRTIVVPEDETRLGVLRRFLGRVAREKGFRLLVSHDQRSLEASGVPLW